MDDIPPLMFRRSGYSADWQLELTTALDQAQKLASSEIESYRAKAALAKEDAAKKIVHIQSLLKETQASREQSAQLVQLAQHVADEVVRRAEQYEELIRKATTLQEERDEAVLKWVSCNENLKVRGNVLL